jgi:hypothetical protein
MGYLLSKIKSPYQGLDALLACKRKLLGEEVYLKLMEVTKYRLASVGIEDLNLRGNHMLLSVDRSAKSVVAGYGWCSRGFAM